MIEKKPNILWIFSDQHRAHAMSCAGDPNIETPNLDRLAGEGIRFTNAYSNCPICSPFRACLYTGQYITTHGVTSLFKPLLPVQPILPEILQDNGWHTSHMGKWHLSGGDCPSHFVSPYFRPGWDEWLGWENSNRPFETEYGIGSMPFPLLRMDGYQTDILADLTIDWLRRYDCDQPWFHVMSIEPPHPPNEAPEPYMAMFRDKPLKYRDNFASDHPDSPAFEKSLRGYYSQIKNLDDNVGKVVEALEDIGQLDNTIIFYFSDHGDMMGSHGKMYKQVPEEESSNIPLIIRYPKHDPENQISEAIISSVDILPSLLGLLGIDVPETVQGNDLSGCLTAETEQGADMALIQFDRCFFDHAENHTCHYRAIKTSEWKYVTSYLNGPCKLYNNCRDPYELNNLIDSPEYAGIRSELSKRLQAKLDAIGDDFVPVEQ